MVNLKLDKYRALRLHGGRSPGRCPGLAVLERSEDSGRDVKNDRPCSRFELESLEPRILLDSALPAAPVVLGVAQSSGSSSAIPIEVEQPHQSSRMGPVISYDPQAGVSSIFDVSSGLPATAQSHEPEAVETSAQSGSEKKSGAREVANQTNEPSARTEHPAGSAEELPLVSTSLAASDSKAKELTETLRAANGPPGGEGQLVYLDFDGATGVMYKGPITLSGISVPIFQAPGILRSQEGAIISATVQVLQQKFAGSKVRFTTKAPSPGSEYSTVYVGGNASAFHSGPMFGVSEKVDIGNRDPTDNAFVFSEELGPIGSTAAEYGQMLAGYIAHETGHLLGFEHAHTINSHDDPLAEVAWKPYTHIEVAIDVRRDLLDDGKLTLDGRQYAVHPRIVEAIKEYPAFYYGGAAGPDGFPDPVMGQGIIHPDSTGVWVAHVLDKAWKAQLDNSYSPAEQLQILAFAYGFATHAAGDVWAHTLVNEFADGIWPAYAYLLESDLALVNPIRHIIVEAYANDAAPRLR